MKITAVKFHNNNLQKKLFIASVGLISLAMPLSANKKQNVTNPVKQICNIKENNFDINNKFENLLVLKETNHKKNFIEEKEKQKDLTTFEKDAAMFSGLMLASLLTALKNKILECAKNINKENRNDESNK